jgi:hypothetical protein
MIETVTNPHAVSVLHAVVALTLWSLVMFLWMYATRLPAMKAMNPQDAAHTHALRGRLPSRVEAVSDNYNHLFEAPTAFYAIAFAVSAVGPGRSAARGVRLGVRRAACRALAGAGDVQSRGDPLPRVQPQLAGDGGDDGARGAGELLRPAYAPSSAATSS